MFQSSRLFTLAALAFTLGLGGTVSVLANPTCRCDEICSRKENNCLNAGGTVSQCAAVYDECFILCGDTWPCGDTTQNSAGPGVDLESLQEAFGFDPKVLSRTRRESPLVDAKFYDPPPVAMA